MNVEKEKGQGSNTELRDGREETVAEYGRSQTRRMWGLEACLVQKIFQGEKSSTWINSP